jgi:2-polyprenyl-3-methyl-5-hydroxy-6-metoxy-1,4-benzoquinol methylase
MNPGAPCVSCGCASTILIGKSVLDDAKLEIFRNDVHGPWLREARARHGIMEQSMFCCKSCGLLFIRPVLSDEETLRVLCTAMSIPLRFEPGWEPIAVTQPASIWSRAVRGPSLNRLLSGFLTEPARVLDVGAAGGELSLGLPLPEGSSVDLLQTTRRYAAGVPRPGIQVRQSSCLIQHMAGSGYVCDLMLVLHVLEHADDPYRFLLECCALLREDGLMVIEVPYELDAGMRVAVDEVFQLTHNQFFAPWSLRRLIARMPLAIEDMTLLDNFHTGVGDVAYPVARALCRKKSRPAADWKIRMHTPFVETIDKLCESLAGSLAYCGGATFKVFFYSPKYEQMANLFRESPGFRGLTTSNASLPFENVFAADWTGVDYVFTMNRADREALKEHLRLPAGCAVH